MITRLGQGRVAVDTSIFIYFIEQHPQYADVVRPVFQAAALGELELVTSAITLLEVLVVPYRARNTAIAERYEQLLMHSRGISVVDIDTAQLRTAAQLRARFNVRTPDALQIAAAVSTGCDAFVTNDRRLPAVGGLRIVQLNEESAE